MDRYSPAKRSHLMSQVRSRDTGPEMRVRRMAHALGFRYRLHVRGLPGHPDLVFPRHHKIILVHGCFWHRHACRKGQVVPKTRRDYWLAKFQANRERDERQLASLKDLGWNVLTIWECETHQAAPLQQALQGFLDR